jgi:hypothetical protein
VAHGSAYVKQNLDGSRAAGTGGSHIKLAEARTRIARCTIIAAMIALLERIYDAIAATLKLTTGRAAITRQEVPIIALFKGIKPSIATSLK